MAESNQTKIVRLETQMTNIEQKVDKLDAKMDNVITKLDSMALVENEIGTLKQNLKDQDDRHSKAITDLKVNRFRTLVVYPTIAAIAGAVISGLIILVIAGK